MNATVACLQRFTLSLQNLQVKSMFHHNWGVISVRDGIIPVYTGGKRSMLSR